ncbi:hypothetical protein QTP88_022718 [Uroleucon formosanum]
MSLCLSRLRYIDLINNVIREDFLEFIPVHDTTGRGLALTIITQLKENGINLNYMIGQDYDGAASMSGHLNGAQTIIRSEYPKALYVHCSAHSLNLAIGYACQIQMIRNCMEELQDVINNETSQKAHQFLATIIKPDFILALNVTEKVFFFTLPLCKYLQKIDCDLTKAYDHVQVVIDSLNTLRQNAEVEFNLIFITVSKTLTDTILSDHQQFNSEYLLWKSKWVKEKEDCRPSSAFEAFLKCDSDFFPNIKQLLTIISTLPVSTTTAERTFSTLRRIKSYLRNSTGNERLTGLALLSVHHEINIDPEEVINIFKLQPRKQSFIL